MNPIPHPDLEAPSWASPTAEAAEDVDEPPEGQLNRSSPHCFQRTAIRRPNFQSSLLTKAILGQPEDEYLNYTPSAFVTNQRRRSLTSNVSVTSTADLTSDTGLTSPSRTNTPSPPLPEMTALHLATEPLAHKHAFLGQNSTHEPRNDPPRKRCIQFACAAKPMPQAQPAPRLPIIEPDASPSREVPRRSCIKFACVSNPIHAPKVGSESPPVSTDSPHIALSKSDSSTPKKSLVLHPVVDACPQPGAVCRPSSRARHTRPAFRANSKDLSKDASQFHEFASGTNREAEWIRQGHLVPATKLTINDTLTMENRIRRLGAEAEEEAEEEDDELETALNGSDVDEPNGDYENDGEDEDEIDNDEDEENFDGYYTDEETGFADSDSDSDGEVEQPEEDGNSVFWTPSRTPGQTLSSSRTPAPRHVVREPQSDSSAATGRCIKRVKPKRRKAPSDTPGLPDSTDFVCGTLDEDKPLEEAYLSCLAARRNEKLRIIPQDIDPSFPASDPEDDDEDNLYNPVAHDSDADVLVHGAMEDLHHGQERTRRRRRNEHASPRKYRSPAPKRHFSPPPPKTRARSPKTLFGRQSPRRMRSPAPRAFTTPVGSPRHGAQVQFHLAGRPNNTHTKSLPRPSALFPHAKKEKMARSHYDSDIHVRGAIDIVKGLERKRQRRKEKFYQKYCNRARRGQIPERKPQPGRGAERMKELGLLMAGKKEQGNYVLSI